MKGLFIPEITAEMFRNGCLESIEALMAEGEIYDIEYDPKHKTERKKGRWILYENQRKEDVACGNYLYICSKCGKSDIHAKTQEVPFCWWCGADMRGGAQ